MTWGRRLWNYGDSLLGITRNYGGNYGEKMGPGSITLAGRTEKGSGTEKGGRKRGQSRMALT